MGVDTNIILPGDVKVRDVSIVAGILAGLPMVKVPFKSTSGFYVTVPCVKVEPSGSSPEMALIKFDGNMIDGSDYHVGYYFFESSEHPLNRYLSLKSTPFWIALSIKVVDFFGGSVDFNDCDETDFDYSAEPQNNRHSDDDGWKSFQTRLMEVVPLTVDDLKAAMPHASYDVPLPTKAKE